MVPRSPAITATIAPTAATSPATTRISASTPAEVDGTSIDTLSVSISNRLSPGFTASPADLNHLVILPSLTVSPSCGIRTSILLPLPWPPPRLPDPLPDQLTIRRDRPQDQPVVAHEFEAPHQIGQRAGLNSALTNMRDRARLFVHAIGAEIGRVADDRVARLLRGRLRARPGLARPVRHDLHGHVAGGVVQDHAGRTFPALGIDLPAGGHADKPPEADDALATLP